MELQTITGKDLTDAVRRHAGTLLALFLPAAVIALLLGIFLVLRFRLPGAVIGTLLTAIPLRFVLNALPLRLRPEQADVFCKYGEPDAVAEKLRAGSSDIFFDNGRLVVTEQYLFDREKPEALLFFPHALAVYPDGITGKEEHLIVYDKWGQKLCYPFSNGKQQIIKISTLTDKIRRHAPDCRCGRRPEDLEYVRAHQTPLPRK